MRKTLGELGGVRYWKDHKTRKCISFAMSELRNTCVRIKGMYIIFSVMLNFFFYIKFAKRRNYTVPCFQQQHMILTWVLEDHEEELKVFKMSSV